MHKNQRGQEDGIFLWYFGLMFSAKISSLFWFLVKRLRKITISVWTENITPNINRRWIEVDLFIYFLVLIQEQNNFQSSKEKNTAQ
jgi:hypothetical protein